MKKLYIIYLLINSVVLSGQNNTIQLIDATLIKADIDTLVSRLRNYHPTYDDYYQKNNIQHKIDSLKKTINDPMSSLEFFRIMQPMVVVDGHTTLTYNGQISSDNNKPLFPFKIVIHNDNLYVKENLSENADISKGSIIELINGVPVNTIIDKLIRYLPGEKTSYKIKSLENQFQMYFQLVYGSYAEFTITANDSEFKVEGAKWEDFIETSKPKFELRFYDKDIAYIYKRSFMPPRDFIHFMDSAFQVIEDKQIKYLIIDNLKGGGMTDLADTLLAYISKNPYYLFAKKKTKISPLTKDYIADKKMEGTFKDGYFIQDFLTHKPTPKPNFFSGASYILTGPLSYSTATCFPASAKCFQNAIIVGEESGQPLLSNGGMNRFRLTHTKLTCYTSLSQIYMPCNNNDVEKGVIPDYVVTPSLDDLLNDNDYTLEYTLKLIRENKAQ
jgi:C-terminal processing protease CtpA/Prc